MKPSAREARRRLKEATRAEFERLIYEAMLTPSQDRAVRLHIAEDVSVAIIAMRLSCSETAVRKRLTEAYEKVSKVRVF